MRDEKFEDALIGYPRKQGSFLTPSRITSGDNITLQHLNSMFEYYRQYGISFNIPHFVLSNYKAYLSGSGLGQFDPRMSPEEKLKNYQIIYDNLCAQLCKQLLDAATKGDEEIVTKLLKAGVSVLDSSLASFDKESIFDVFLKTPHEENSHITFLMHGAYIIALVKKGNTDAAAVAVEKYFSAVRASDMTSIKSAFIEHADVNTMLKVDQHLKFSESELCNCLIRYIKNKDFDSAFQLLKVKTFKDPANLVQIKKAFLDNADDAALLNSRLYCTYSNEDFRFRTKFSRETKILLTTKLGTDVEDTLWNRYQENCKNLIKELCQSINALVTDPNLTKIINEKLKDNLIVIENVLDKTASEHLFNMLEFVAKIYNEAKPVRFRFFSPQPKEQLRSLVVNIAGKMAVPKFVIENVVKEKCTLIVKHPDEKQVSADKESSAPTPKS